MLGDENPPERIWVKIGNFYFIQNTMIAIYENIVFNVFSTAGDALFSGAYGRVALFFYRAHV